MATKERLHGRFRDVYTRLRRELAAQGWRSGRTKNGEMWFAPDGVTTAVWHFTHQDHRTPDNFIRDLRKGGFQWPPKPMTISKGHKVLAKKR